MARSLSVAIGVALALVGLMSVAQPFVQSFGPQGPLQMMARAGLSSSKGPQQGETAGSFTASIASAAIAGAAMVSVWRGVRPSKQTGSLHAVRRDLSIAYEDSGVELLDNGKFAQGLVGSEGAWGKYEFDPVGFSKYTEAVPYFREAELKHGRIAMLAWLGLVVPDFVRIPGERYSFEAIPVTIDAHDKLNGAVGVNFQVLFWVAILEFCCAKKVFEWNSLECAGDYGFGVQFLPKDEEGQRRMRLAELKNGRLAMVAFGGAITQAAISRHPFPWLF